MKPIATGLNRAPEVGLTPGMMEAAQGLEPCLLGLAGPVVCHVT